MSLLYTGSEWTVDVLDRAYEACEEVGRELKLDWYPNSLEIVSFREMLEIYASHGMPVMYEHWSFGKSYLKNYNLYRKGYMGLALEMVINTNPCVNYLLDENTATGQTLVMAHAGIGHNSFFKNNYLFRERTQADSIVDYLVFAKRYVAQCEERYGQAKVEAILDCAHSLMNHGVDKYRKPKVLSAREEEERQKERLAAHEANYDEVWGILDETRPRVHSWAGRNFKPRGETFLPNGPEENLLYFIEKKSPILKPWQRELIRIVRKVAEYFSPQTAGITQVANEGWATTVHYYAMNRFYERGLIDDGAMLEFLNLHTSVVYQPAHDDKRYSGFNPYHLGHSIFMDMKRICEDPTEEDRYWFPDYAGGDWLETWHHMFKDYRDDSFIQQFLSPKLMRDMKMFVVDDDTDSTEYVISKVHDERGYRDVRKALADSKSPGARIPDVQVHRVDFDSRTAYLVHHTDDGTCLNEDQAGEVMDNFSYLWGFGVELITRDRQTGAVIRGYESNY